ncbi:MAG: dipeptide/oligopeptide/nickel ABC transporter ATP-binding protein, partial [Lachnospiraceae bacterium]
LLSAVPIPDPTKEKKRIILQGDLPSTTNPPQGCLFHTRCPYCTDKCRTQRPQAQMITENHMSKCHYPDIVKE